MSGVTSAQHNTDSNSAGRAGTTAAGSIPLSSAESSAGDQSLGGLVHDATTHLSTLVRAEVELAKSEVTAEVKKGLRGSIFFILALTVLLFSTFFFFVAVAEAIAYAGLPQAVAFGIVFGFMVLVALVAALLGYLKVRKIRAPQRTISTVKEIPSALRPHREHQDELPAGTGAHHSAG
jgi:uncharacterized membrane protein YqjE